MHRWLLDPHIQAGSQRLSEQLKPKLSGGEGSQHQQMSMKIYRERTAKVERYRIIELWKVNSSSAQGSVVMSIT